MKFKIHYEIGEHHDSIIIQGDTMEEVRQEADEQLKSRGLTVENNNVWSEEIEP